MSRVKAAQRIEQSASSRPGCAASDGATGAKAWRRREIALRWGLKASLTSWTETLQHVRWHTDVGCRLARETLGELGRPLTRGERERLSAQEHADLDMIMFERAREVLTVERGSGGLLLAPVSFFTVATASSRSRLISVLAGLRPEERTALMFELEDVALGTPVERVKETLDALRPYCRGVVVRCEPMRAAVEALRGCAIRGLSLDLEGVNGRAGEAFGRIKLLSERSRGVVQDVMALGLPPSVPPQIMIAGGANFHSVRPAPPDEVEPV